MSATRHFVNLLTSANATGDWVEWPGGDGRVELSGTVGGATVTLQVRDKVATSTGHTVGTETTFADTGTGGFKLEAGCEIRLAVSGGTPSGLNANAFRI